MTLGLMTSTDSALNRKVNTQKLGTLSSQSKSP